MDARFGVESTAGMMVGFVDFVAAEGVNPRPVNPVIAGHAPTEVLYRVNAMWARHPK